MTKQTTSDLMRDERAILRAWRKAQNKRLFGFVFSLRSEQKREGQPLLHKRRRLRDPGRSAQSS